MTPEQVKLVEEMARDFESAMASFCRPHLQQHFLQQHFGERAAALRALLAAAVPVEDRELAITVAGQAEQAACLGLNSEGVHADEARRLLRLPVTESKEPTP